MQISVVMLNGRIEICLKETKNDKNCVSCCNFQSASNPGGYEQQYCWGINEIVKDYNKNLFFSSQGLVQYHQHISIEKVKQFFCKHSISFENLYLLSCWFNCVDIFYIEFRFYETFTDINFVTRILLTGILHKFRSIRCWSTLYLHCHIYDYFKFKCFYWLCSNWKYKEYGSFLTSKMANVLHFNNKKSVTVCSQNFVNLWKCRIERNHWYPYFLFLVLSWIFERINTETNYNLQNSRFVN